MIKQARATKLIEEHRELRKEAFMRLTVPTSELFRGAEEELRSCKTASEASGFNRSLLRHFSEP